MYSSMFFLIFCLSFRSLFLTSPGALMADSGRSRDPPNRHLTFKSDALVETRRPFSKNRLFFIKKVVSENSSKSGPKKSSKSDSKVRKKLIRQAPTGAPESASEPWSLQGRLLGRPGVTFSSFSVPFCIKITKVSFSFLEDYRT